jgi:hypothetical protein
MVAGRTFGIQSSDQVTLPDDNSHRTIGDFLDWKNYAEDYPSYPQPFLGDRGKYVRKHVNLFRELGIPFLAELVLERLVLY